MGMYEDKVEEYLKTSLENLKLDYVDLYLIHSPEGIKSLPKHKEQVEMDLNVDHAAVWKVRFNHMLHFSFNISLLRKWKSKLRQVVLKQ